MGGSNSSISTDEAPSSAVDLSSVTFLYDISSVPDDIVFEILLHLDLPTLAACARTCQRFNAVTEDELLWQRLFTKHSGRIDKEFPNDSWKENVRVVLATNWISSRYCMKADTLLSSNPRGVLYHEESRTLCTSEGSEVKMYYVDNILSEEERVVKHMQTIGSLNSLWRAAHDGNVLVAGSNDGIGIYHNSINASGEVGACDYLLSSVINCNKSTLYDCIYHHGYAVAGAASSAIHVVDVAAEAEILHETLHTSWVFRVRLSEDRSIVTSASGAGDIAQYDLRAHEKIHTFKPTRSHGTCIDAHSHGYYVQGGFQNNAMCELWDVRKPDDSVLSYQCGGSMIYQVYFDDHTTIIGNSGGEVFSRHIRYNTLEDNGNVMNVPGGSTVYGFQYLHRYLLATGSGLRVIRTVRA